MKFEEEYLRFVEGHKQKRTGESLRRLQEGHFHSERLFLEKVWWPLFHHFKHLHPEYVVDDFKDGKRYLDFAYIRSNIRVCFEIDGYGPHLKNISRWQFADQLERQNQLLMDGWLIIRFSVDQVTERPRHCQQVTQQVIGRLIGEDLDHLSLSYREKEIIRYAIRKGEPITPGDIRQLLNQSKNTIKKLIVDLVKKEVLVPANGKQRIRSYQLNEVVKIPLA